jgi:hypothetical protein
MGRVWDENVKQILMTNLRNILSSAAGPGWYPSFASTENKTLREKKYLTYYTYTWVSLKSIWNARMSWVRDFQL